MQKNINAFLEFSYHLIHNNAFFIIAYLIYVRLNAFSKYSFHFNKFVKRDFINISTTLLKSPLDLFSNFVIQNRPYFRFSSNCATVTKYSIKKIYLVIRLKLLLTFGWKVNRINWVLCYGMSERLTEASAGVFIEIGTRVPSFVH